MRLTKKILFAALAAFMLFITATGAFAVSDVPRVCDGADLLTEGEEAALLSKLDEISVRQRTDVAVVTAYTLGGKTPAEYAGDFYDNNGFGFGDGKDGVLLLVSMEDRDWYILTNGFGNTAVTADGIEYISNSITHYLSNEEYAQAFGTYAELCDEFFAQAQSVEPYGEGNMPKESFNVLFSLCISAALGFAVAFISTGIMRGKLKTVRHQPAASNYIKDGSMNVTECRDLYLYSHISRIPRPKESGSGGSRTHISHSGASRGGGGGKF